MMMDASQQQPPDASQQQAPDSGAQLNDQVRKMIMDIGQLAQRVPEAKAELDAAAGALTKASLKLVAGQKDQAPSQPMVGA